MERLIHCPFTDQVVEMPPARAEYQDLIDSHAHTVPDNCESKSRLLARDQAPADSVFIPPPPLPFLTTQMADGGRLVIVTPEYEIYQVPHLQDAEREESVSCDIVLRFLMLLLVTVTILGFQLNTVSELILGLITCAATGAVLILVVIFLLMWTAKHCIDQPQENPDNRQSLPSYSDVCTSTVNPPPYKADYDEPPQTDNAPPSYEETQNDTVINV